MDEKNYEKAVELRRKLHTRPELSGREVWTRHYLIEFLQANTTRLDIVDRGKPYFYAVYRAGADLPTLAFRADFDALPIPETIDLPWGSQTPGVSHKCGHDGHSAGLAAFALEVDQKGAACNVVFLFQHGEETGIGAREAKEVLAAEGVDEIYGLHNSSGFDAGTVALKDGVVQMASRGLSAFFSGTPSHAGYPELGKNPSFAMADAVAQLPQLVQDSGRQGQVLCTIVQMSAGGPDFGVQASEGVLRLTLRAGVERELDALQRNIEGLVRSLAEEQGLEVRFELADVFPETTNDPACADKVRAACRVVGVPQVEMTAPLRPSEDFGGYCKSCPAAFFYVGNGKDHPPIHDAAFDFRDQNIRTAVAVFSALAGVPAD